MTEPTARTQEAIEAETTGERPDLGRTPDTLAVALTGGADPDPIANTGIMPGDARSGRGADRSGEEADAAAGSAPCCGPTNGSRCSQRTSLQDDTG